MIIIIEGIQLYDGGKYICDNLLRERVVRSEEPDCFSRSNGAYYPPHHSGWNTGLYEGEEKDSQFLITINFTNCSPHLSSYPVYPHMFTAGIHPHKGNQNWLKSICFLIFLSFSGPVSFGGFSPPSSLLSSCSIGPSSLQLWQEEGKKEKKKKKNWFKLF